MKAIQQKVPAYYVVCCVFRLSMLLGTRDESRPLEHFLIKAWPAVDGLFVGRMSKYRGIGGQVVAKGMQAAAKTKPGHPKVYHWQEMQEVCR